MLDNRSCGEPNPACFAASELFWRLAQQGANRDRDLADIPSTCFLRLENPLTIVSPAHLILALQTVYLDFILGCGRDKTPLLSSFSPGVCQRHPSCKQLNHDLGGHSSAGRKLELSELPSLRKLTVLVKMGRSNNLHYFFICGVFFLGFFT